MGLAKNWRRESSANGAWNNVLIRHGWQSAVQAELRLTAINVDHRLYSTARVLVGFIVGPKAEHPHSSRCLVKHKNGSPSDAVGKPSACRPGTF